MELSRHEYPALLASLQPSQATAILRERINLINKVNIDIADWLQERRRVEEAYAQGLRKLSNHPQLDDAVALGVFQIPWKCIIEATESLAESHETLALKIEMDVERPLREYGSKNDDLASMPGVQSDLTALAKDLEGFQKRVDKSKDKGSRGAEKVANALSASEEANQQWNSRAPFVFEQLQAVDESRLNHLRDVLTQLETHEVDQVERCRQAAESCLNVLLNVETSDEIKAFAAKVNENTLATTKRETSSLDITPIVEPPLPPPPRAKEDTNSERPGKLGPQRVPTAPEPRHTTHLGGFRRLGTVMNRTKSIVQPFGGSTASEKKHRRPFGAFKRADSAREIQIPESAPEEGRSAYSAVTAHSNISEPAHVANGSADQGRYEPSPSRLEDQPDRVTANGLARREAQNDSALANRHSSEPRVDSEGYTEKPDTIDEITLVQREASGLDESGMNITIRDQPILEDESEAKQAMDDMANTLRLRAQQTGTRRNAGTIRGRRDVRNTVFMASPLVPGQEDMTPLSESTTSLPTSPLAVAKHVTTPITAADDHTVSDSTSIRSGNTLHSAPVSTPHPDLHEPGLNASIIETVSAWLSEGSVNRSFVVGELALAYNPQPDLQPSNARVRLRNFQILEKVAANPHFVSEVLAREKGKEQDQADDKRGEYDIILSNIARPVPTVAFKYQVHLDQADVSAYCPVIFKSAWNIEEFQASAIIFYSSNPKFICGTEGEPVILKNLVLSVNLDTSPEDETTKQLREVAHATNAVMHPSAGATFRRKQSAVVWKLNELEVKSGEEGKFLVRFSTSTSWPRKGKIDAKFSIQVTRAQVGAGLGISIASQDTEALRAGNDPFADEAAGSHASADHAPNIWKEVPTARKLVTGRYSSS